MVNGLTIGLLLGIFIPISVIGLAALLGRRDDEALRYVLATRFGGAPIGAATPTALTTGPAFDAEPARAHPDSPELRDWR